MAEKMGGRGVIGGARQGGGSVAEDSKMDKRGELGREVKEKDSHGGAAVLEATKSWTALSRAGSLKIVLRRSRKGQSPIPCSIELQQKQRAVGPGRQDGTPGV